MHGSVHPGWDARQCVRIVLVTTLVFSCVMAGYSRQLPTMVLPNGEVHAAQKYKVGPTDLYGRALEGGRGCMRACMVHLEEQGKLTNTFTQPFRRRPQWQIPWPRE